MATVLVVDDSRLDRTLIGNLLQRSHLEIAFATDGRHALQLMGRVRPNLVVSDLMMPNLGGLELAATIATTYPFIPIILTTGHGSDALAVEALNAGASSYVPKSMLRDWLLDSVEDLLSLAVDEQSQVRMMDEPVGCQFSISNDAAKISGAVNYLRRFICRANVCDDSDGIRVCVALEEALNNALYHGNLELDSGLREGDRKTLCAMAEARRSTSPYCDRQIHVAASVHADHAAIAIRDEGRGFDAAKIPDPTEPRNLERLHGRGLLLMRRFMDEVKYNDVGNEVTLIKRRQSANSAYESEARECQHRSTLPSNRRMTS